MFYIFFYVKILMVNIMQDVYLIVPSLEPKEEFVSIIKEFKKVCKNIIVVNDGSSKKYDHIFNDIKKQDVIVLKHDVNKGKGRALKTAFSYLLDNNIDFKAIVTADSDGQHVAKDIKSAGETAIKYPDRLILGARDFNNPDMFRKNKLGNKITCLMFKLFVGITISDTQTGLRAISKKLLREFLEVKGERFEYETNMLIYCKEGNIKIKEVPITCIYNKEEYSSHFNNLKDSFRIYSLFIKYILASLSSFAIDIILFALLKSVLDVKYSILLATIIARIISSLYNYFVNAKLVFKKATKSSIIKYYSLVVIQMFISGICVSLLDSHMKMDTTMIKLLVDVIIFIVNFVIQREWVFKEKDR